MGLKVRRLGAALVIALGLVLPLQSQTAAPEWRAVANGVEHAHVTRQAPGSGEQAGPWNIHLLRVDLTKARPDVLHARDEAVGLETVSAIAQRAGAIAAINGGYFRTTGTFAGDSTGTLQIDGSLLSEPDRGRSAVGFVRSGRATRLVYGHVGWDGTVRANGQPRRLDGINRARGRDEVVLFTPRFHESTLTDDTGTEIVVRDGRVVDVRPLSGNTRIPRNGLVISTTGDAQQWAQASLRPGVAVRVALALRPVDPGRANPWRGVEDVLGAGPKLVTGGRRDITTEREKMLPTFATDRHPRTAIATLADGRALMLVVDGRQPTLSVGMSLDELARTLIELGAVEAMNLDGGGSSAMVVQGKLMNRPSDATGERPVSDAIVVRTVK